MLVEEFNAVEKRIEKGKPIPGLISLNCNCSFFHKYLLPCRHIFHEDMCGTTKLLVPNAWIEFQQMFEETGFEIYVHRELVEVEVHRMNDDEKAMENRKIIVNELTERIRDVYWRVEERGDVEQTGVFIRELKNCLDPILNN
jgi:hypothetical protein